MLIRIADALDTSVSVLLGETAEQPENSDLKIIAEKLELLNEQFAQSNEQKRRARRTVFGVIAALSALIFLSSLVSCVYSAAANHAISSGNLSVGIIGGSDGPTNIYLSTLSFQAFALILAGIALVVSVIGIIKSRRH